MSKFISKRFHARTRVQKSLYFTTLHRIIHAQRAFAQFYLFSPPNKMHNCDCSYNKYNIVYSSLHIIWQIAGLCQRVRLALSHGRVENMARLSGLVSPGRGFVQLHSVSTQPAVGNHLTQRMDCNWNHPILQWRPDVCIIVFVGPWIGSGSSKLLNWPCQPKTSKNLRWWCLVETNLTVFIPWS